MLKKNRFIIRFPILVTIVLMISSSSQGETLIPALGARSAGRGGTNFAFSDNGFVLHDNPAGLISATRCDCGQTQDVLEVSMDFYFPT